MEEKHDPKGDPKREKVRVVDISNITDFPEHPFLVKDDESMMQLVKSIEMNGVLNPVIARRIDEEHYELISGHRRKHACMLLGIEKIPLIGRDMTREEAIIEMVDSNLQREHILPSEKARAYKMKMEAMKQQGKRTDLTSAPVVQKLTENTTRAAIAIENGESHEQVRRYIRLNELIPKLLEFVDEGKIGIRPAVELSYLRGEEQQNLLETIESEDAFPSHAQAIRMKELSRSGNLNVDQIFAIMTEQKGNQKEYVKIPMERLTAFFPRGTPPKRVEEVIIKALTYYRQRQRENRDTR